jgi:hypothetical protein
MASSRHRRAPRVDALLRVRGELVPVDFPITLFNLSRTGFALSSEARFRPGDRLEFHLTAVTGPSVRVTAAAVHTRPLPDSPGWFVTGFQFVPERRAGVVPEAAISRLIDAIAPAGWRT